MHGVVGVPFHKKTGSPGRGPAGAKSQIKALVLEEALFPQLDCSQDAFSGWTLLRFGIAMGANVQMGLI